MKNGQFPAILNLTDLNGQNGFKINGATGDDAGFVAGGGDINGDGLADFMIGAPHCLVGNSCNAIGYGYLIFGNRNIGQNGLLSIANLNGTNGFKLIGETASDATGGYGVSFPGDINNDGYGDILIGAYGYNGGTGRSYVVFGGVGVGNSGSIALSSLDGSNGFKLDGEVLNDNSGLLVSGAGDINHDGVADFLIGAPIHGPGNTGRSYAVFGKSGSHALLPLANLNGTNGFKMDGEAMGDISGRIVASAGDVNKDGIADFVVGAYGHNNAAGRTYVIFGNQNIGKSGFFSLSGLNGTNGFRIDGEIANDFSGLSAGGAGDINGDGYADLFVGAPCHNSNTGRSYVVFGGASSGGSGLLALSGLNGINGFKLDGEMGGDLSGEVSAAGDVNGDGYADLIIGSSVHNGYTGRSYVVFGGARVGGSGLIPLSSLNGINGFKLDGESAIDAFNGLLVANGGDINGDGVADVLIGILGPTNPTPGRSYVVFGDIPPVIVNNNLQLSSGATLTLSANYLSAYDRNHNNNTLVFIPSAVTHGYFSTTSAPGTPLVNFTQQQIASSQIQFVHDGTLVAPSYNITVRSTGIAWTGPSPAQITFIGAPKSYFPAILPLASLNGQNGFKLDGENNGDLSGFSVSAAGDINRDGYADFLIGAPDHANNIGRSYVVFGGPGVGSSGLLSLSNLNGTNGFKLDGEGVNEISGNTIASIGDINADGYADLFIGAPYYNANIGRSYVVFGAPGVGSSGLLPLSSLNGINGFKVDGEINDLSGVSASASDINGDGQFDLIIGAGNHSNAIGRCYVVFGGSGIGGNGLLALSSLNGVNGFTVDGEMPGSWSGNSLSVIGDINDDGYSDFIIGAVNYNSATGRSYVVFGGPGVGSSGSFALSSLNGVNGFKIDGENSGDSSGASANAGDINGDGRVDLLIGAYTYPGGSGKGRIYAVFGEPGVGSNGSFVLSSLNGINGFKIDAENDNDRIVMSRNAAGDINGDGYADVLIGAWGYSVGTKGCGYVVFGGWGVGASGLLSLSNLNGNNGFKLDSGMGDGPNEISITNAGDINGDGITDLLIGVNKHNNATGRSYVVFGDIPPVLVSNSLSLSVGAAIQLSSTYLAAYDRNHNNNTLVFIPSAVTHGYFSTTTAPGTPLVNFTQQQVSSSQIQFVHDGTLVAPSYNITVRSIGIAWTGPSSAQINFIGAPQSYFPAVIPLASLNGQNGFKLDGENNGDSSSISVSKAGDINGDGYADLIIGAYFYPRGGAKGRSYVVFGGSGIGSSGIFSLSSLTGINGFKIDGENDNDQSGISVSAAGDINGDGHDDLIIGAFGYPDGNFEGRSYVVFGRPGIGSSGLFNLSSLTGANGFKLDGENYGDRSSFSVSAAGDINGDGYADLVIGANYYPVYGGNKGRSYVIFGGSGIGSNGLFNLSSLNGANGFKLDGENDLDGSGVSVSAAGDINGDGRADLIVGAYGYLGGSAIGCSYVVFGGLRVNSSGVFRLSKLNGSNGFKLNGENNGDHSGYSVSAAGDINDDGYDDLIIGAYGYLGGVNKGRSYVVFGGPGIGSSGVFNLSFLVGANGFKLDGENNGDYSGLSVGAASDINGDDRVDLLIGAMGYSNFIGRSYVVFGNSKLDLDGVFNLSNLNGANGFKLDGENNGDYSGHSVSLAGDINGDGVADVLIGAYGHNNLTGRSYVVFGDIPPVLVQNRLTIQAGKQVRLNSTYLSAYDRNHNNNTLIFTVSALTHGHFELTSKPGAALSNFTQLQLTNNTVLFIHDGSSMAPSYNITVHSAGIAWTGPSMANVTFILPPPTTTPIFSTIVLPSSSSSTTHTVSPAVTPTPTSMPTPTTTLTLSPTPTSTLSISSTPTTKLSPSTTPSPTSAPSTTTPSPIMISTTSTPVLTSSTTQPSTVTPTPTSTPTLLPTSTPTSTVMTSLPILVNNQLTLSDGETIVLSSTNLQAVEVGMNASSLIFYVSNVQNGYFSLLPINASVTRFIQSYVQKSQVQFVHSGDHQAPSYSVVVSDGAHATAPSPALIDFIGAPTITTTPVTLTPGGSTTLTTSNLNVSNTGGSSPNQIVFQVSDQQHVQFNLNTSSTPVSNFTLTQVIDHSVQLVPDNSNIAPSYSITVTCSNGLISASTPVNVQLCNSLTNPSSCAPTIVRNNLWIKQDMAATLTTQNLYATDSSGNSLPSNTVFYVTNVNHGYFNVNGSSNSFFTQQQLQSGIVQFMDDGTNIAPSYQITVQSSNLQTNSLSQVTLSLNNKPPYLAGILSNQIAVVSQPFSLSLGSNVFTDPQGDPLILSAGVYNSTQLLPSWLSFNPSINRFSGTPTESGVLDIGVTATDPEGLSMVGEFSLTVNNAGNEASNFNVGLIAGIGAGAVSLFLFGCCLYKYLRKPNAQAPTVPSREGKTSVSKSSKDIELLPLQSPRKVTVSQEIKTSSQSFSSEKKTEGQSASFGNALIGLQVPGNLESLSVSKSSDRPASPSLPKLVDDVGDMKISLGLPYRDLEFDEKDELGAGAYGTVYKGTYKFNDVAIKELHTKHLSQAAVEELKQEAGILGSMRSDYIVQLRGICLEAPHYCLVMELMPKGSLYGLLQNSSELPLSVRYRIGLDVCYGLYQLHELNILHRDLKSLNVLLDDRLRAKISDFGLSKVKSEMSSASSTKGMKGTLGWMAPELFAEKPQATTAADIYALGMVLWEMMINPYRIPFQGLVPASLVTAKGSRGEKQETIPDSCPPEMADLIKSCWQEPGKRPSAEALAKSLSTLFKSSPARPSVMQDEKAKTEVIQQDDLLTVFALNN